MKKLTEEQHQTLWNAIIKGDMETFKKLNQEYWDAAEDDGQPEPPSLMDQMGIKVCVPTISEPDPEPERVYYNNPNKKEKDDNKVAIGTYDDGELLDRVYLFDKENVKEFQNAIDYAHENEEDKEYMSFTELIEEYLDMNQIPYEIIGIGTFYCIGDDDTFNA